MKSKIFIFLIFSLFLISFASAIPPVQTNTNSENGLQVFYPAIEFVPINAAFSLHIHVSNLSNGFPLQNTDIDCHLHLYNSSGSHTYTNGMEKDGNGWDHEVSLSSGNFSDLGQHAFYIWCNNSYLGGEAKGTFIVTPTGEEGTTSKAIFYIGILFLLLILFIASIYGASASEQLWTKTGLGGVAYLLMVAITFIAWMMSANFMTTAPFMIEFLRIAFIVLTVAIFPVLIGLFCYGFWMMMRIDEIKKLQEQGYSDTEAAEKVKNRRKF